MHGAGDEHGGAKCPAGYKDADGSTDIYFGPTSPGEGKNWLATIPGRGWFTLVRLYGRNKAFFDKSWRPDDIVKC